MRILYLTEFLTAIGGGGEVMFRSFAVEMANRGHKVDLVCHQSIDSWDVENDLLTVHRIPPPIPLKHGCFPSLVQQLIYITKLVIKGSQIIDKNGIDLIHANTISPSFAGAIIGKVYNIPVITTIHHVHSLKNEQYANELDSKSHFAKLFSLPKFLCERMMVRLPAVGIHTVSEASKDDVIRFGAKDSSKIKVVPNAVDLRCLDPVHDVQYGNFALFIGRLVEYKNLDVIITAFRKVVDALPEARLVIVGDGPAALKWKDSVSSNGLSENIQFLGYITEERKDELLRNCLMLVFPSLIEGFGLVILEAFARKKPVIVSDVRPLNELVDDGIDGFVIRATNPAAWAEQMLLLFKNKSICEAMGTKGRKKVEERFNLIQAAEDLESFYEKLIGKQNGMSNHERCVIGSDIRNKPSVNSSS